jgi:hypothetical protein
MGQVQGKFSSGHRLRDAASLNGQKGVGYILYGTFYNLYVIFSFDMLNFYVIS